MNAAVFMVLALPTMALKLNQEPTQFMQIDTDEPREIAADEIEIAEKKFSGHANIKAEEEDGNTSTNLIKDNIKVGKTHYHQGLRMTKKGRNGKWTIGDVYSKYLTLLLTNKSHVPTIAQVGAYHCNDVAMWAELFPESRIYGFDQDLQNCHDNWEFLKKKGFKDDLVTLHLLGSQKIKGELTKSLEGVLGSTKPSIVVDDGCHEAQCSISTFKSFRPLLQKHFLYFIEGSHGTEEKYVKLRGEEVKRKVLETYQYKDQKMRAHPDNQIVDEKWEFAAVQVEGLEKLVPKQAVETVETFEQRLLAEACPGCSIDEEGELRVVYSLR